MSHAFPRAGNFTISESVTDARGERIAKIPVEVARRSPLMAVPPGASSALVFDHFWNRFGAYRALLTRALPAMQLEPALAHAQEALGFDPADPKAVERAGIDPDEGVAWITFADDPNGRYLAVGTLDDARSEATVQAILRRIGSVQSAGPNGFTRAELDDGSEVYFKHDRGYLLVRLPPDGPGPALGLAQFAGAPPTGVADDPAVRPLRAKLPSGDVIAYLSHAALVPPELNASNAPLAVHLSALLASVSLGADSISGEALWGIDEAGRGQLAQLFKSSGVPTLLSRAPAGAALYLGASANLRELVQLLLQRMPAGHGDAELELAKSGIDLRAVLNHVADAGALATYFDAAEFYRALSATRTATPRGEALLDLRVTDPAAALQLATQLLSHDGAPRAEAIAGGTRLEATFSGHPAGAFVGGDQLLLSWGLRRLDVAIEPPSGRRLRDQLPPELQVEAQQPGRLVLYVDVAGVLDALDVQQPVPGLSPEELLRAQLFARIATASFAPLRDVSAVVAPAPEGLSARFNVRLR